MMLNVSWISFRDFVQDFLNFLFAQESWARQGEVSEPKYGVNLSKSVSLVSIPGFNYRVSTNNFTSSVWLPAGQGWGISFSSAEISTDQT